MWCVGCGLPVFGSWRSACGLLPLPPPHFLASRTCGSPVQWPRKTRRGSALHNAPMHATELWEGRGIGPTLARIGLAPLSVLYAVGWEAYLAVYRLGLKRA